tara:strand:+ start:47 stop:271 length:225 start_codon:yes stop_codon:yes gene_type:complete
MKGINMKKYNVKYKVKFTKQELERIWYVFNQEVEDHKCNIRGGGTGYEGCLYDAKLVVKKLKPLAKKLDLYCEV